MDSDEQKPQPLSNEELQEWLASIGGQWSVKRDVVLTRTFRFRSFREATEFVGRIADAAEREQKIPDIMIRSANVTVELSTPPVNGLSERDFLMAKELNVLHDWEEEIVRPLLVRIFSLKAVLAAFIVILLLYIWKVLLGR